MFKNQLHILVEPSIYYISLTNDFSIMNWVLGDQSNSFFTNGSNRLKIILSQSVSEYNNRELNIGVDFMNQVIPHFIEFQIICKEEKIFVKHTQYRRIIERRIGNITKSNTYTFKSFSQQDHVTLPKVDEMMNELLLLEPKFTKWFLRIKFIYDENKTKFHEHELDLIVVPHFRG